MNRALVNGVTAFNNGVKWIDSTVTGMGRGAGNIKTEYALLEFSKKIDKLVVITRGEKGALAIMNNEVVECSAKTNLKIVDLTGAGDLFAGGFLHGYINGKTLKESLDLFDSTESNDPD